MALYTWLFLSSTSQKHEKKGIRNINTTIQWIIINSMESSHLNSMKSKLYALNIDEWAIFRIHLSPQHLLYTMKSYATHAYYFSLPCFSFYFSMFFSLIQMDHSNDFSSCKFSPNDSFLCNVSVMGKIAMT